jgi:hypothetical protein
MTNLQKVVIFSTKDYNEFAFFPSNRPADHWPKVAKSIDNKDFTPYNPIICTKLKGRLYIIDGQNRFLACKSLGLPIFYVVAPDCNESDIASLNIAQKNWSTNDYLNFYVSQGRPSYLKVQALLDEYPFMKASYIMRIHQRHGKSSSTIQIFKNGDYKLDHKAESKVRKTAVLYKSFIDVLGGVENIPSNTAFISALSSLVGHPNFSPSQMVEKIKKYPYMFEGRGRMVGYVELLEYIYNYRQKQKVQLRYAKAA